VMQLPQKNPSYPSGHVPDTGTGFDAQRSKLCGHGSGLDRQRELASSLVAYPAKDYTTCEPPFRCERDCYCPSAGGCGDKDCVRSPAGRWNVDGGGYVPKVAV
jgi:hypothetical protein